VSITERRAPARPDADEVLAVVRAAFATVLERDEVDITRTTPVRSLGADSLALVEVAEIVEETLAARTGHRLHIPDDELASFDTVGAAVDYALARLP
jgi:acyl carrier protein